MDKFIEEIKSLSRNNSTSNVKPISESEESKALNILFDLALVGMETFNKTGSCEIKLHKIPADLVPLFFNFHYDCGGFVIKTGKKFIFIMQSEQNKIFIYGLSSRDGYSVRHNMNKAVQLLILEFKNKENGVKFFDSTNKEIKPEEIILQALKWGIS